jgi:hypothetical protein
MCIAHYLPGLITNTETEKNTNQDKHRHFYNLLACTLRPEND